MPKFLVICVSEGEEMEVDTRNSLAAARALHEKLQTSADDSYTYYVVPMQHVIAIEAAPTEGHTLSVVS